MRTLQRFGGFLLTLITAWVLTGCSHTVSYKLDSGDRWGGPVQNKTVRVDTFVEKVALPDKGEVVSTARIAEPTIASATKARNWQPMRQT